MSEVRVSGGLGGLKNTREDMAMYPGSGYRGPTSSSGLFFVFRSTQIGGYNEVEREFGRESLGAIPLLGGEVTSLASNGNAPRSCWVAEGGTLCCSSRLLCSRPSSLLLRHLAREGGRRVLPAMGADFPLIF